MIDREQNLRLGDARKLSQMMQGERALFRAFQTDGRRTALRGFDLAASLW